MSNPFQCPSCAANLEYDGGNHLTVKCDYCSSTVIVPESLRPQDHTQDFAPLLAKERALEAIMAHINKGEREEAIRLYASAYNVSGGDAAEAVAQLTAGMALDTSKIHADFEFEPISKDERTSGCGCLWPILLLLLIGGGAYMIEPGILTRATQLFGSVYADLTGEAPSDLLTEIRPLLEESGLELANSLEQTPTIFAMGERGINPGQFNDPRGVAIGEDGVIFVADSGNERIQQFTSHGAFNALLIHPDGENFNPRDIEYGPGSVLYSMESNQIDRFDIRAGTYMDELIVPLEAGSFYTDIHMTADGDLVVLSRRDKMLLIDLETNEVTTFSLDVIPKGQSYDAVTTDIDGNFYIAGEAEDELDDPQKQIFKLSPNGQFVSQFGNSGFLPGRFSGIFGGIAINEAGFIFVSDFQGIQVFNRQGEFERLIGVEGFVHDLALDQSGHLIAISNEHILYKIDVSQIGSSVE